MRVTIVEAKNVMTIEDLANKTYVGWVGKEEKRHLVRTSDANEVFFFDGCIRSSNPIPKLKCLENHAHGTFHVFDTAKELYLWMAE